MILDNNATKVFQCVCDCSLKCIATGNLIIVFNAVLVSDMPKPKTVGRFTNINRACAFSAEKDVDHVL